MKEEEKEKESQIRKETDWESERKKERKKERNKKRVSEKVKTLEERKIENLTLEEICIEEIKELQNTKTKKYRKRMRRN